MSPININQGSKNPFQGQGKPHTSLSTICSHLKHYKYKISKMDKEQAWRKKMVQINSIHRPGDTRLSGRENNCVLYRNSLKTTWNGLIPG